MLQGKTRLTGGRAVAWRMQRLCVDEMHCRASSCRHRYAGATADKIRTDRLLSGWRSPRTKGEATRRRDAVRDCDGMPDPVKTVRHRQLRRRGYERGRDEKDRSADRTIAVIVAVILRRSAVRCFCDNSLMCAAERQMVGADRTVKVHVAERYDDLQQKRRKREIRATPFMAVNPPHATAMVVL